VHVASLLLKVAVVQWRLPVYTWVRLWLARRKHGANNFLHRYSALKEDIEQTGPP
jgi:hypothetical protein